MFFKNTLWYKHAQQLNLEIIG